MRFGMKVLLPTLWVVGGALYLGSTLISTRTVKPFDDDLGRPPIGQLESTQTNAPDNSHSVSDTAKRRHAILPEQPSSDPTLPPTAEAPPHEVLPLSAESWGQETSLSQPSEVLPQPSEKLRIKSDTSIRDRPTDSAQVIGTAKAGAEIQIKSREGSWVQFVGRSGDTGWIDSSSAISPTAAGTAALASSQVSEESSVADTPKPKTMKQRPKKAPEAYIESDDPPTRRRRLSTELSVDENITSRRGPGIELPSDEDFLAPRKRGRFGILERRRFLRDGLLSPEFLPPR
jgi:hypothetical protein